MSPAVPKPDSNSYYFPPDSDDSDSANSDDESSSDESLDHGGDIVPPADPAVDAVAPAHAPVPPETPPRSPSPAAPLRLPSPIGIGARLPRRTRTKPREWWKLSNAQLDDEVDDEIEDADMGYEIACSTVSMAEPPEGPGFKPQSGHSSCTLKRLRCAGSGGSVKMMLCAHLSN